MADHVPALKVCAPMALTMRKTQAMPLVDSSGRNVAFVLGEDEATRALAYSFAHAAPVMKALRGLLEVIDGQGIRVGLNTPEFWAVMWAARDAFAFLGEEGVADADA